MIVERRPRSIIPRLVIGGSLVAGSFGLISLGAASTASAATCGNSTDTVCPAISLSDVAPSPGGVEIITGTGYAGNESVALTFNSTPVSLGDATTDGTGAFTTTVAIPTDAVDGTHTIVGTDTDGNTASAALTVVATTTAIPTGSTTGTGTGTTTSTGSGSTLPLTGSDTTKGLLVAADLALLGAPLLLVARRRKA